VGELEEIVAADLDEMREVWALLVENWETVNAEREQRGIRAMKPGVIWHQFKARFGCKPPPGCRLPIELATDEEKQAALVQLRTQAKAKGYKPGWVGHRFAERFGHAAPFGIQPPPQTPSANALEFAPASLV
jgi:hypothetical protein